MDVLEAIRTRRSIREFTGESIPDETIELILDTARYAPSPENMQMWRYIVIRKDQALKKFIADISQEMASRTFGSVPYEATSGRLWWLADPGRAATYEVMKDGDLFRYPEKADTVIIGCASETFHDAGYAMPNILFGSVVVGMGMLQMWLIAHKLGIGCAYQAFPLSDPRHMELVCEKIGIPTTWRPLGCLCLGVPEAKRMLGPSRWPLESVMFSERWGNPYTRIAFRK
ncbi:MAG: nitroreductase family protein [Promethearchaeota archaeon]